MEIVTEKDPEAVSVGGFFRRSQVIVILVPRSKTALLMKSPSIPKTNGGVELSRVTFPVLLNA